MIFTKSWIRASQSVFFNSRRHFGFQCSKNLAVIADLIAAKGGGTDLFQVTCARSRQRLKAKC